MMINTPKNVILITIDALRSDHLGCYGYHRKTPEIDILAEKGTIFTEAIANGSGTPSSFTALFTSSYPLMYDGYSRLSMLRTPISLVMKKSGYHTAGIHSNPYLSRYFGFDRGFDYFEDFFSDKNLGADRSLPKIQRYIEKLRTNYPAMYDLIVLGKKVFSVITQSIFRIDPKIRGDAINKKAFEWIDSIKGNFFLWIHYMDVHSPYLPTGIHLSKYASDLSKNYIRELNQKVASESPQVSKDDIKNAIDLYDCEISYIDQKIGELINGLRLREIIEDSILIITSDHGEAFFEHGSFFHGQKLFDELLRVPLIIYAPTRIPAKKITTPVSLMDIAPTIIDLMGIENNDSFQGKSLLPFIDGYGNLSKNGIYSEDSTARNSTDLDLTRRTVSYRTTEWKYIYYEYKEDELFHLTSDPQETINLVSTEKVIARELKEKILSHIEYVVHFTDIQVSRNNLRSAIKKIKTVKRK